ncbi:hypothetical protein DPMN_191968 [Dreissena polymorpha]|uniref:Uncharacterized protein n=1 Tax=Dreissena polymorpha TaxID=45954 RepID=A0A9D3Y2J5_DREPO|nr:hypothetical protein DPMN_191968 [Dreissena polymorpha]
MLTYRTISRPYPRYWLIQTAYNMIPQQPLHARDLEIFSCRMITCPSKNWKNTNEAKQIFAAT